MTSDSSFLTGSSEEASATAHRASGQRRRRSVPVKWGRRRRGHRDGNHGVRGGPGQQQGGRGITAELAGHGGERAPGTRSPGSRTTGLKCCHIAENVTVRWRNGCAPLGHAGVRHVEGDDSHGDGLLVELDGCDRTRGGAAEVKVKATRRAGLRRRAPSERHTPTDVRPAEKGRGVTADSVAADGDGRKHTVADDEATSVGSGYRRSELGGDWSSASVSAAHARVTSPPYSRKKITC